MWKTTKEQPKRLLFENIFGNIANLEYFPPQVTVAQRAIIKFFEILIKIMVFSKLKPCKEKRRIRKACLYSSSFQTMFRLRISTVG